MNSLSVSAQNAAVAQNAAMAAMQGQPAAPQQQTANSSNLDQAFSSQIK